MAEGQRFDNVSASDSVRQHVGNAYYNSHNYYQPPLSSDNTAQLKRQYKRLLEFAQDGQLALLKQHVENHNLSVDYEDDDRLTALHCAAWSGSIECIDFFINSGVYVNAKSDNYGTPLCLATLRHHTEAVQHLLQACGADADASGGLLGSPLHAACLRAWEYLAGPSLQGAWYTQGSGDMVRSLLGHGADPHGVRHVDFDFAQRLLSRSFPCEGYKSSRSDSSISAIGLAVQNSSWRCIQPLLDVDQDAVIRDFQQSFLRAYGRIPMMRACQDDNNLYIVRHFLEAGNGQWQDSDGDDTALMWAACSNADLCVLELGLSSHFRTTLDQKSKAGKTALMLAAERGHTRCVETLLTVGSSLGIRDSNGNTAVDLARRNGHRECVRLLGAWRRANLSIGQRASREPQQAKQISRPPVQASSSNRSRSKMQSVGSSSSSESGQEAAQIQRLPPSNLQFEYDYGHGKSLSASKRVMEFFRRRGKDRGEDW